MKLMCSRQTSISFQHLKKHQDVQARLQIKSHHPLDDEVKPGFSVHVRFCLQRRMTAFTASHFGSGTNRSGNDGNSKLKSGQGDRPQFTLIPNMSKILSKREYT